jgi:hypothetical protein
MSQITSSGSGGASAGTLSTRGSDNLTQRAITVSAAVATELYTGATRNPNRQVVRVFNDGNVVCYLGPSAVTASGVTKGEELEPGEAISYTLANDGLFAITLSGSTLLIVTELA